LIDDILATGGTINASIELIDELGGIISDVAFISEITELDGYSFIKDRYPAIEIHILSR
jgi:adenine phosphoribosyltransferase